MKQLLNLTRKVFGADYLDNKMPAANIKQNAPLRLVFISTLKDLL
jgi:hypothetical protein